MIAIFLSVEYSTLLRGVVEVKTDMEAMQRTIDSNYRTVRLLSKLGRKQQQTQDDDSVSITTKLPVQTTEEVQQLEKELQTKEKHNSLVSTDNITRLYYTHYFYQWRSEGIWRPGANLNFAPPPPPQKKS